MKLKLKTIIPILIIIVSFFAIFYFQSHRSPKAIDNNAGTNTSTGTRNYDGTYSGKFNYEYKLTADYPSSQWIPASFDLAITVKGNEITNVYSSEPGFGTGPNGVVPIADQTNIELPGGLIHIGFPNGTSLQTSEVYMNEKDPDLLTFLPSLLTDHDAEFVNNYLFWKHGGIGNDPFATKTQFHGNEPAEWADMRVTGWSLRKVSP